MAIERLTFNEDMMMEIIEVIRAGMEVVATLRLETEVLLTAWCDSGEEYARECDSRRMSPDAVSGESSGTDQ